MNILDRCKVQCFGISVSLLLLNAQVVSASDNPNRQVQQITGSEFAESVVGQSRVLPIAVEFYATWCGPCRQLQPALESVANEFKGRVNIVRIDGDEAPELVARFRVHAFPTVIFFKDGLAQGRVVGVRRQADLESLCASYLSVPTS